MSTLGLSKDTESAILTVIDGLRYEFEFDDLSDDKVRPAMESKVTAFKVAKDLIDKWKKSVNAPNQAKLIEIIKSLIKAGEQAQLSLRKALKLDIDYKELDPSKHKAAIMAKPIILQAIYEFEGGLYELRTQVELGVINTEDDEFQIGFPERIASGEYIDRKRHFKNWYNEKEDAVKICPFGTEGEIITLEGLKVQLPTPPKQKSKILFHDKPKEQQFWQRLSVPTGINNKTLGQFTEYIVEEYRRRVEGIWFYNNGKPTYLTGDMYFALQWGKMLDDGKYMLYREPQARMFYHSMAVWVDSRCVGKIFEKSRRTGFTYEQIMTLLNRITMTANFRAGMTSKTEDDVKIAFKKLTYAFLNLPFFFRPVVKGRPDSVTALDFAKPVDATKEGKKKEETGVEKYLNSMADWRLPTDDAYDSEQLNYYLGDEFAKRKSGKSVEKHFRQIRPTMIRGGIVIGKMFLGSTIGAKEEGGGAFENLANGSEVSDRDKMTKMTATGLYRYALYAHENHEMHIDTFGICHETKPKEITYNFKGDLIVNGSLEYLVATGAQVRRQSDIEYNEYMRTMPITRADMYRQEGINCQFNIAKIQEQIFFNKTFTVDPVERGNFYRNESGIVHWKPDDKGKFRQSWLPPVDMRNKFVMRNGKRHPANGWLGAGGVDSYDIDETVDGRSSNGSLHFFHRYNTNGHPSTTFVLEYIERPPYANIFYEDVMMAAEFYGYPLLIENNKYGIVRYFENKGMLGYVLKRPSEFTPSGSKGVKQYGIPSNSIDIIQTQAQHIEEYIHYNVGIWGEKDEEEEQINNRTGNRPVGDYGNMYFERTLQDWAMFNIKNRTKFDATISSSLAIMASTTKAVKREGSEERKITEFVRRYKSNGLGSKINRPI